MQEKKTGVCVGRLWNNIIGNRKEGQKMQIEGDQCRRCGSLQTEVIDRRYRKKSRQSYPETEMPGVRI